jgi:hypothetical protein
VLFIASVLIPFFLQWRELPSVRLFNTKTRRNNFEWKKNADEQWEATLNLSIQNRGRRTLEKYYWEIYVEKGLSIGFDRSLVLDEKVPTLREEGEKYWRYHGYMEVPIFQYDHVQFPYRFRIHTKEKRPVKIYYFFRTEYGPAPMHAWIGTWQGWMFLLNKLQIN